MPDSLLLQDAVEEDWQAVSGEPEVFELGIPGEGKVEEFKIQDIPDPPVPYLQVSRLWAEDTDSKRKREDQHSLSEMPY